MTTLHEALAAVEAATGPDRGDVRAVCNYLRAVDANPETPVGSICRDALDRLEAWLLIAEQESAKEAQSDDQ